MRAPRKRPTTCITINPGTIARLVNRAWGDSNVSRQIEDDLTLLWSMLDRAMSQVRQVLTRKEISLILDAQNGMNWDSRQFSGWTAGWLAHQVTDGCLLECLDNKWEIDRQGLISKINGFSEMQTVAILDFCRHMWRHSDDEEMWQEELNKFKDG